MTHILIIEDDIHLSSNWCEFLTENGYECKTVQLGEEVYPLIEKYNFDLVVSDLQLPDITGFEIKSKFNNDNVRIPVIFVTGHQIIDGILRARQLGAIAFLQKPIFNSELLDAVSKALEFNRIIKSKREYLEPLARLVITQNNVQVTLDISRSYTIGREESSDIRLISNKASRNHAMLNRVFLDNGSSYYKIIDYSRNGIRLNSEETNIVGYRDLKSGDVIHLPGCTIAYTLISEPRGDTKSTYY